MNKVFVFVRGEETELKKTLIRELIGAFEPGSYMHVNLDQYGTVDRKTAHRMTKESMRNALKWDTPRCFIISNPSLNPPDWDSYLSLATPGTVALGIDVMPENQNQLNLQLRNVREFIVSVYKYQCVKLSDDISGVVREIKRIVKRGEC